MTLVCLEDALVLKIASKIGIRTQYRSLIGLFWPAAGAKIFGYGLVRGLSHPPPGGGWGGSQN